MKLRIPRNSEPDWGKTDRKNEKPVPFTLSADFAQLTAGTEYVVLKFTSKLQVPKSGFLGHPNAKVVTKFVAQGTTHRLDNFDTIISDQQIFYRTVPNKSARVVEVESFYDDSDEDNEDFDDFLY